jgi:hypothetical protein
VIEFVMNVTPTEFHGIVTAIDRLSVADFEAFMVNCFGCRRYCTYRVRVRMDVPGIPWMTAHVERFEPAAPHRGVQP